MLYWANDWGHWRIVAEFRYKAFISYSHKNSRHAAWLMKRLESYQIPDHLRASAHGAASNGKRLGRMFRDREELSASGCLDSQLLDAITNSEFLIVICSPDSAKSMRVNEEIDHFITHRDSRNILCMVVEGEPDFGAPRLQIDAGCIPPSLKKQHLVSGHEPLAADARMGRDGKALALQKLIAALLRINLDELIRRDSRRKQTRLLMGALASFGLAVLTTTAMLRAKVAEESALQALAAADHERQQAENLLDFMLEDLSGKLRQVGRMEVIDAVVAKLVQHYESEDDASLSAEALGRKASAYSQLGRLYLHRDQQKIASDLFAHSYETTKSLISRHPNNRSVINNHTQGLYWVGVNHLFNGRYSDAEQVWRERVTVAQPLWQYDDHTNSVWGRLSDMNVHHGWALMELGRYEEALVQFYIGLAKRKANLVRDPERGEWRNGIAGGHYHVHWALKYLGRLDEAYSHMVTSTGLYGQMVEEDPTDQRAIGNYARSLRWLSETEIVLDKQKDAAQNLRKSLSFFKQALEFEPENMIYQYQSCVSMVVLSELQVASGNIGAAKQTLASNCPTAKTTLSLSHFKVHQRFHSYRLSLVRLQIALADGDMASAMSIYERVRARLDRETTEILTSPKGSLTTFEFAVQAARLDELTGLAPEAQQMLSHTINNFGVSPLTMYPPAIDLAMQARLISRRLADNDNLAR